MTKSSDEAKENYGSVCCCAIANEQAVGYDDAASFEGCIEVNKSDYVNDTLDEYQISKRIHELYYPTLRHS